MAMKKKCPLCGWMTRMRRDGTFYKHATTPQNGMVLVEVTDVNRCTGSLLKPEHAAAIAADQAERTDLHVGVSNG